MNNPKPTEWETRGGSCAPAPCSSVICESGPLRWKTQINGVPKLQGVFTMRDQEGFPVDMSYEIAKERGWEVDWLEALADAARQGILKYDALLEEIRMLEPTKVDAAQNIFASGLMSCESATFCDKSAHLYKRMRGSHLPNAKAEAGGSSGRPIVKPDSPAALPPAPG
jgi:hypothetical protein